jgi:hypothetical protein
MFNFLINLLTFPGVMLHEWSHQFYCQLFRVPVLKVVYFRFGNPMGYVVHAEPRSLSAAFWISIGPLTINSLFCFVLSYATRYTELFNLKIFLLWLAFAFAFHALPSKQDATNMLDKNNSLLRQGKFYYIIFWPFIGLAYLILVVANKLKFLSLDFIYAITLMYLAGGLKF